MIIQCCKDCTDRVVGCHSTCEKYKILREELDKENSRRQQERMLRNFECSTRERLSMMAKRGRWK